MVYSQVVSWEIIVVVPFLGKTLIYVYKYILSKHFNNISLIETLSDVVWLSNGYWCKDTEWAIHLKTKTKQ